jgi:hypothetical protein
MRPKETKFFVWGGVKWPFRFFLKNCQAVKTQFFTKRAFFKKGTAKPFWKVCSNQEAF